MAARALPLDFLGPAGTHQQQHGAIATSRQQHPPTRHLPPGLPGARDGHHHLRRAARTPASSSSSASDAGEAPSPQLVISTYLRRISQAAEALAAAADQEDHALRADGVLPGDGNLLVMEAICRETVGALRAIQQCSRAVTAASSSASTPSPPPGARTDHDAVVSSPLKPRKRLLSPQPPPHLRRHRVPAATTTASSSSASCSAAAAAAAGGAPPAPKRQRSCTQCGCTETPFWRRGPLGSRSLCNVCGLLYARRARDRREVSRGRTLQWAGSSAGEGVGAGDDSLPSWRSSGGSSGSLFP